MFDCTSSVKCLCQPVLWLYSHNWPFQRQYVVCRLHNVVDFFRDEMISHHTSTSSSSAVNGPDSWPCCSRFRWPSLGVRRETWLQEATFYDIWMDYLQRSPGSGLKIGMKDQDQAQWRESIWERKGLFATLCWILSLLLLACHHHHQPDIQWILFIPTISCGYSSL